MSTVHFAVDGFVFEWDLTKAKSNRRKRGVSFEEAATVSQPARRRGENAA